VVLKGHRQALHEAQISLGLQDDAEFTVEVLLAVVWLIVVDFIFFDVLVLLNIVDLSAVIGLLGSSDVLVAV